MDKKTFQDLLDKYLQGNCNEEEAQLLFKFYDYFQGDKLWNDQLGDQEIVERDLFKQIERNIERKEREAYNEAKSKRPVLLRVGALLLVLMTIGVSTWFYFHEFAQEVKLMEAATKEGQKSTVMLSDGSQVRLNSDSKLTFPETFDAHTRKVYLEGEAYFDVARDEKRPFVIQSGKIATTVLGTSFNVKAFSGEDAEVTVASGKVQVEHVPGEAGEAGESVLLMPKQQAHFDLSKRSFLVREVDLEDYLSWKEGIIKFENTELKDAVKTLERWYGVHIKLENEKLAHCMIRTGTYENENLYNILRSFKYFLGVEIDVQDQNHITIKGTGCQ